MATIRDFAIGQVLTAPSPANSGTSLVLDTGQGDDMPTTLPYKLVAFPEGEIPTKYNSEKILVTAQTDDTLTIVRAQGETTAKNVAAGWYVSNSVFADDFATSSFKVGQTPGGSVNGSNTAFTTPDYYVAGTLKVYLNGQSLVAGASDDFVETSSGFTMNYAPATGDKLRVDYLTSDSLNLMATDSLITGQLPTGSINGSNTVFTTASPYAPGSLRVFKNGVRLYGNGEDYTETSPALGTFTMVTAPATGTRLVVDYTITGGFTTTGSNSFVHGETPSGTVNGSNATFTVLNGTYVPNSLEVFINGLAQKRVSDFTETTPGSGIFTLIPAPITGDVVTVNYQLAASTSANADTVDGYHASSTAAANRLYPLNASAKYPYSVHDMGAVWAKDTTTRTTTSTSFVDLSAVLSVTCVVPASGAVKVTLGAYVNNNTINAYTWMSVALTGANTVAANDNDTFATKQAQSNDDLFASSTFILDGLTPGSTTFTVKHRVNSGTGTFNYRRIIVEPIG